MAPTPDVQRADRSSGVLAHITSLPSRYGVGDLGPAADAFVQTLGSMCQRWWQMLPIGPTGFGDSPYQALSSFAGNPLLISLERLATSGLLGDADPAALQRLPRRTVDFGRLTELKTGILATVAECFRRSADADTQERFLQFREEHGRRWLDEFVLFAALKAAHDMRSWHEWERGVASRDTRALRAARRSLSGEIAMHEVLQFLFFEQWRMLRDHCRRHGILLVGDLPLYVAHDSADVWAHRHLFQLDPDGLPTVVAGVPPDYFAETGQRWGNPIYDWEAAAAEDYSWWRSRLRHASTLFDLVRFDHFRGLAAYWEIRVGEQTAVKGRWVDGPGTPFLSRIREELGALPLIAEDLGIITDDVTELRQRFGLVGMRVAQFGFDEAPDTALHNPAAYPRDVWAYTGTHDNDTTLGWFWGEADSTEPQDLSSRRQGLLDRAGTEPVNWKLIRLVSESRAVVSIFPVQDLLGLGTEARMNTPGTAIGNWTWRMREGEMTEQIVERMRSITVRANRS